MKRIAMGLVCAGVAAGCMDAVEATNEVEQHSPAVGVTPTLLARGAYPAFKVESKTMDLKINAKDPIDLVVRQHDYAIGSHTGWHQHPGPVFITVKQGTLTFYEADDPSCTPLVISAPGGYVDTGHGHIVRNESGAPAVDMTVITAPPGATFRGEIPPPGNCPFDPELPL
ncbi:MAG TPA: hypothetical protein VM513_08430 [Kofleriaceae bacterium]|nr:hypothetical protein [Kofleriaceae bacterium]